MTIRHERHYLHVRYGKSNRVATSAIAVLAEHAQLFRSTRPGHLPPLFTVGTRAISGSQQHIIEAATTRAALRGGGMVRTKESVGIPDSYARGAAPEADGASRALAQGPPPARQRRVAQARVARRGFAA